MYIIYIHMYTYTGDMVPVTYMGRYYSVLVIFVGIILIILPIAITSVNFRKVYGRAKANKDRDIYENYLIENKGLEPATLRRHLLALQEGQNYDGPEIDEESKIILGTIFV